MLISASSVSSSWTDVACQGEAEQVALAFGCAEVFAVILGLEAFFRHEHCRPDCSP